MFVLLQSMSKELRLKVIVSRSQFTIIACIIHFWSEEPELKN